MSSFQEINALSQNCAEIFEFSDEDAQRILFPAMDMETRESCEDLKIKLERLSLKETRLTMHGSTLSEYWRNKKIPRGLRIQKAPTIGKSDEDFVRRWGEILNKCSLDLILLIVEHVAKEANLIKAEIEGQENQLKEKYSALYPTIKSSLKETVGRYADKLLSVKLKKYKRDTEDYQKKEIYSWQKKTQASSSQVSPTRQSHTRTTGFVSRRGTVQTRNNDESSLDSEFTLDSDSSQQSRNPRFLGKGTRRPRNAGRNAVEGNAPTGGIRRPWTRSKSKPR